MEGLISKMRNIHKSTPPSFRRRENAAAIVKAPPPGALTKGPDRKFPGLHPPLGGATSPSLSTNRRFAFPILALLAALAVGLLFLLPGGPLQAQDADGPIMYPENGTGPVATYTAVDPEMTAIASGHWAGPTPLFSIEGGVLSFKKSPDFETRGDVAAADGSTATTATTSTSHRPGHGQHRQDRHMKMVEVMVTNVDEPGMVTLSALQPQAGTELIATNTDPDGGIVSDLKWQWAKSMTMDGTYEDIDKAILSHLHTERRPT